MTTCHNCYKQTTPDCSTCPRRTVDNRTTLDIENAGAEKLMNWSFAGFLVLVAVGLIILTGLYL